jgi:hypothetical protein
MLARKHGSLILIQTLFKFGSPGLGSLKIALGLPGSL